jgi:rhodanese-related sulfurtransferase
MDHSPGFLKIAEAARARVTETDAATVRARIERGDTFHLIDVREDHEWDAGHLPGAEHLGRGILERDIESRIPDHDADIVVYCGGGYRSALAADNLQRMGYTNVKSMDGGWRGWTEAGYPAAGGDGG